MTLFRLDASIRVKDSTSRDIADIVEQEWLAAHPGDTVKSRHIGVNPIPATYWAAAVDWPYLLDVDRSQEHAAATALAETLVDELLAADGILFAVPLYNFGPSQHFKAYIDLVATSPRVLNQPPFLAGKKVVLATVRGGAYGEGTPRHGWDHSTPYLRRILADTWGADLTVVEREFTLVGVNPALDEFEELAAQMHAGAVELAREAGKALGAL